MKLQKESLPKSVKEKINQYFELHFGSKRVRTPYFMNLKKERGGLRVMVGKGSVEEIVHETKVWAQLRGINISRLEEKKIREFMISRGIGIDCSGFVVHVINSWLSELGMSSLSKILKFDDNSLIAKIRRLFRPIENISADLLTSGKNTIKINNFNDIEPGDLIRAKGKQKNAHHVAIITDVYKDKLGNVQKFNYVHSHRYYGSENGIRKGTVRITKPKKDLVAQDWNDNYKGKNYMLEDVRVKYKDNGIRRLRAIQDRV